MPNMTDFKIRRGLSAELFPDGELNSTVVLELGCWYLCTDTAELFLCTNVEDRVLKRINSANSVVNRPTTAPDAGGNAPEQDTKRIIDVELDSDTNLIFRYSDDSIDIIELSTVISDSISAAGHVTEEYVKEEITKSHPDLSDYASKDFVSEQISANKITILDGGGV